jgi:hypothetical protein
VHPSMFRVLAWQGIDCNELLEGRAMNKHLDIKELRQPSEPKRAGLMRRMLGFLAKVFSGAKGDQGGWEGGTRGL